MSNPTALVEAPMTTQHAYSSPIWYTPVSGG
jgi:hypothetical protein